MRDSSVLFFIWSHDTHHICFEFLTHAQCYLTGYSRINSQKSDLGALISRAYSFVGETEKQIAVQNQEEGTNVSP